jgi:hypothetical protein
MMEILIFPIKEPEIVGNKNSTTNHRVFNRNLWTISVMKIWMKTMNMMAGKSTFVKAEPILDTIKRGAMLKDARKRKGMTREIIF